MPNGGRGSDVSYGPKLRYTVVVVVMVVWTVGFLADIALESYEPPWSLHLAMIAVIGVVLGTGSVGRNNGRKDER